MRMSDWSSNVCSSNLDIPLLVFIDGVRIYFGHDQRNVGVHPIKRAIIDDDAARLGCLGRIDLRGTGACRKQRNVPPGEIEMLDILDLQLAAGFAKVDRKSTRLNSSH